MKIRSYPLKPFVSIVALGAALLLAGPTFAQECVSFQGIDHCPVGESVLLVSEEGLTVQSYGTGSGVSSRFAPTVHWSSHTKMPVDGDTNLASISGGEITSRLAMEPEGDSYLARAMFTGASEHSTYSVLVYKEGVLQGALGGLDGNEGSPVKIGEAAEPIIYGKRQNTKAAFLSILDMLTYFSISPNGGCNWGIGFQSMVSVKMPDGSEVEGDEIRFAEEVSGPGHYPYLGFESIEITSTASSFVITDELAEGTR